MFFVEIVTRSLGQRQLMDSATVERRSEEPGASECWSDGEEREASVVFIVFCVRL